MKYRYHVSIDCEGAIQNAKYLKGCITTDEGKTLNTVKEVRDFFREQLALGRKVIPCGDCDNFDYQTGCKGHVIEEKENDRQNN